MNPIVDPYAYGEFDPEGVPETALPVGLPVGLPCDRRPKYLRKTPCFHNVAEKCQMPGACTYSSQHVCAPMPKAERRYGRGIVLRPRGEAACDAFDRDFAAAYE
jgi:hypothetical protein